MNILNDLQTYNQMKDDEMQHEIRFRQLFTYITLHM